MRLRSPGTIAFIQPRIRVRKCLFATGAAVSLLMLIGVVIFWAWSRSHAGYVRLHQGEHFLALYPAPDGLTITSWRERTDRATSAKSPNSAGSWPKEAAAYAYLVNRNGLRWQHLGIQWSALAHLENGRSLILPNGMLLAAFAVLPLLWLRRWSRMRGAALMADAPMPQLASA
jgi:hypothetical protein